MSGTRLIHRSWIIPLLIIGVLLDLLIGAVLIVQNVRIQQAASENHILKAAAYEACLAGNASRQSDLKRWDAVLRLLDTGPSSPALQRFVAGVRAANGEADRQADCAKVRP